MHIRDLVKQRWADAGLYARKNARLQSFLKHVEDTPSDCWDEYAAVLRRDYADLYDLLIPPLMTTDDKLLRVMLLRQVDVSQPKELAIVRDFVARADPVADRPELNVLIARDDAVLRKELRARPELVEVKPVAAVRVTTNMPPAPAVKAAAKPARKAK